MYNQNNHFFFQGLCLAIPGPTLLDLQENTHTDTKHVSQIFTGRSLGYLTGSVIGGVLVDKTNEVCLLSASMLLTAAATALTPWCGTFLLLMVMMGFQGFSMGSLDTGTTRR